MSEKIENVRRDLHSTTATVRSLPPSAPLSSPPPPAIVVTSQPTPSPSAQISSLLTNYAKLAAQASTSYSSSGTLKEDVGRRKEELEGDLNGALDTVRPTFPLPCVSLTKGSRGRRGFSLGDSLKGWQATTPARTRHRPRRLRTRSSDIARFSPSTSASTRGQRCAGRLYFGGGGRSCSIVLHRPTCGKRSSGRTCWVPCERRSGARRAACVLCGRRSADLIPTPSSSFKSSNHSSATDALLSERNRIDSSHRMVDDILGCVPPCSFRPFSSPKLTSRLQYRARYTSVLRPAAVQHPERQLAHERHHRFAAPLLTCLRATTDPSSPSLSPGPGTQLSSQHDQLETEPGRDHYGQRDRVGLPRAPLAQVWLGLNSRRGGRAAYRGGCMCAN